MSRIRNTASEESFPQYYLLVEVVSLGLFLSNSSLPASEDLLQALKKNIRLCKGVCLLIDDWECSKDQDPAI
jgi:hypothetical protein